MGTAFAQGVPQNLPKLDSTQFGRKALASTDLPHQTNTPTTPIEEAYRPFVGRLFFGPASDRHYCTAQFVQPGILLTAAHCTAPVTDISTFCYVPPGSAYIGIGSCPGNGLTVVCMAPNKNWKVAMQGALHPDNLYIGARYDYAFLRMPAGSGADAPTFATEDVKETGGPGMQHRGLRLVGYPLSAGLTESSTLELSMTGISDELRFRDVLYPRLMAAGSTRAADSFGAGVSGGAWFSKKGNGAEAPVQIISLNSSYSDNSSNPGGTAYRVIYGPSFDAESGCYRQAAISGSVTGGQCNVAPDCP
jgi:hypothetical protein